ncbi:MAG: RecX family transcriptional regulator [Alistipes sp.]|nr:RecX family transcriptional regulator [Alistipes sp.]
MRDKNEIDNKPRERRTKTAAEALQSLMRLCSRAEKSSGDALRLMRTWGVPEGERQGVLDRLVAQRFIDDRRYAEAYVREKSQLSGWGARKIAMQLRQKGINGSIISAVLATLDGDDMRQRLKMRLERKLRTVKATTEYDLRGKLLRHALSAGYDYDLAVEVIDEVVSR